MVHQNRLLDVVRQESLDAFITFMSSYKSSTDDDLVDVVTSLSGAEQDELWEGLHRLCTNELLNVGKDAGATEISFSEKNKMTILLKHLTTLLSVYLPQVGKSLFDKSHVTTVEDEDRPVQIPAGILQTAIVLHELLPILPDHTDVIKNQLCRVFESWWKLRLDGKDELIGNTLFYLLEKILDAKSPKALIKRLWSVHEGFQHIDVSDSDSPRVQTLIRCFRHVPMLTVDEGRKFLSYLFIMNESLIDKIHPCIKNHIIAVPKFLLPKIGEVYYLAWKAVTGLALEKIERDCIQDLMYLAVHANRASSNSLADRLRKVLSYFQKQNGVPALLARLYEPFLWRSLKVANGHVRGNSVGLLIQAFPLLDPAASSKEKDTALQRQTDILQNLLHDPCVDVRCITVSGVCRILDLYWSTGLLPADMIQAFLTRLVRELAWDVSSSLVRAAVITGLTLLLNQHLSHPVLKQLLPELRDCIHDKSEKVRLSMMELLLKIKALQTIKFWNVVPPAHLLARLEIEQRPMATRIVRLLFPSYVPTDTSLHLDRCVSLIESNPGAARQFYNYVPKYMTLADCTAYMVLLCRCVLQCVRKFTSQNDSINADQQQTPGEVDEGYDEGLSVNDTQVMTGMLEAIALLWTPNVATLEKAENAEMKRSLHRKFAVALPEFLHMFQEPAARQAIVIMCGYMPPELIPTFSRSVLSKLKDVSSDDKAEDYAVLLDAMFNWGKMSHVLELVTDWLDESEPVYENQELDEAPADKCAKVRKRVQIIDPRQPKPGLCVSFLSHVLTHQAHYQQLFMSNRTELLHIIDQLKNVTQRLVDKRCSCHTQQIASGWSDDVLIDAFLMYLKLAVILHKPDDSEENDANINSIGAVFESVFHWAETQLVTHLNVTSTPASDEDTQIKEEMSSGKRKSGVQGADLNDLAVKLIQVLLQLGSNVLLVGMADDTFAEQYTQFCIKLAQTDVSREFLHSLMSGLYQLSEFYCTQEKNGQNPHTTFPKTVETFYSKLLQKLAHVVEDEFVDQIKKTEQLLADLRLPYAEILQSVWKLQQCISDTAMSEVMASTMAAVIANLTKHSIKDDFDEVPTSLSKLSPFSGFLLSGVFKHTYMSKALMEEIYQCITCSAINTVHGLNATSFLLATLQKCHPSLPRLCECRLELRSQILDFKHSSLLQQPVFSVTDDNDDMPESALLDQMEKRLEDLDLLI